MAVNDKLLAIYLNDHLAGSTAGLNLARRTLGSNRDTAFGPFLAQIAEEIDEDRETLRQVMARVGAKEDPLKKVAAAAGERAGRLKLNGSLRGYSPLSRLVEFEALALGVAGKRSLWRALAPLADARLSEFDFPALEARAEEQRKGLEEQRLRAAMEAFEH